MVLNISESTPKELVFEHVAKYLHNRNIKISEQDSTRPWGGFFVIDESESEKFIETFFPKLDLKKLKITGKLSPKILIVAPQKRLSWQYHHRRAEIWNLIAGKADIIVSDTDDENERTPLSIGNIIQLEQGKRHRLIGLDAWGIVAEIWQHTDSKNPSDEDDIVRLQDDFGR